MKDKNEEEEIYRAKVAQTSAGWWASLASQLIAELEFIESTGGDEELVAFYTKQLQILVKRLKFEDAELEKSNKIINSIIDSKLEKKHLSFSFKRGSK